MKKIFVTLAAICCFAATSALAVPISGNVNFSGGCSYSGGTTPADATGIDFLGGLTMYGNTGNYAEVSPLTPVTFQDFTFSPDLSPSPVDPLWQFVYDGKTYSFVMNSVTASSGVNSLTLDGTGMLAITGFDDTPGNWIFTTQGQSATLSFSATSSVPEPGTILLLGGGLLGLAFYGRRRMSK